MKDDGHRGTLCRELGDGKSAGKLRLQELEERSRKTPREDNADKKGFAKPRRQTCKERGRDRERYRLFVLHITVPFATSAGKKKAKEVRTQSQAVPALSA